MKTKNMKSLSWDQILQEYGEQKFNFYLYQKNCFFYKDIHGDLSLCFGTNKDLGKVSLTNRMTLTDLVSQAGVPDQASFKGVDLF